MRAYMFAIMVLNDNATEEIIGDDDKEDDIMDMLDFFDFPNVQLVRCTGHGLQLCVYDVNKQREISKKISSCCLLFKALRSGRHRYDDFTIINYNHYYF